VNYQGKVHRSGVSLAGGAIGVSWWTNRSVDTCNLRPSCDGFSPESSTLCRNLRALLDRTPDRGRPEKTSADEA